MSTQLHLFGSDDDVRKLFKWTYTEDAYYHEESFFVFEIKGVDTDFISKIENPAYCAVVSSELPYGRPKSYEEAVCFLCKTRRDLSVRLQLLDVTNNVYGYMKFKRFETRYENLLKRTFAIRRGKP